MARVLRGAVAELFRCTAPEVLIEGRAGTGKSIGILTYLHDRARRYPGCRILICRQHRATLTESIMVSWEEKVLGPTHPLVLGGAARVNRHSYEYPNGSSVVLGGLDQPGKLFSTEYDFVYVNEATEITLEAWELFGRAMRNNRAPYQQVIADCNPGAPSHWLNKRAFVCDDVLRAVETADDYRRLQRYTAGPQDGPMRRMVSVHQDNPAYFDLRGWRWTDGGAAYLAKLDAMTGHRRERMRHGRWVASEGNVFPEFGKKHVLDSPFTIPTDWPIYWGYDPGVDHPTSILWFAVAPNNTIYVIDEIYGGGLSIPAHAKNVRERERAANWQPVRRYGDPQEVFNRQKFSARTIAAHWADEGIKIVPWPRTGNSSRDMVEAVRKRLIDKTFKVFPTCVHTIEEFETWRYKRTAKGELPPGDDQFEDANNHCMDVIKGVIAAGITSGRKRLTVLGAE